MTRKTGFNIASLKCATLLLSFSINTASAQNNKTTDVDCAVTYENNHSGYRKSRLLGKWDKFVFRIDCKFSCSLMITFKGTIVASVPLGTGYFKYCQSDSIEQRQPEIKNCSKFFEVKTRSITLEKFNEMGASSQLMLQTARVWPRLQKNMNVCYQPGTVDGPNLSLYRTELRDLNSVSYIQEIDFSKLKRDHVGTRPLFLQHQR